MYKREDFKITDGAGGIFISLKDDCQIWLKDDLSFTREHEWFYFPSKTQAKKAITKFLARQNETTIKNTLEILFTTINKQAKDFKKSLTDFNEALAEAEKISKVCFEKPEKVFSLVKWITCWKNNPEYISQAILDGWVSRCEGKTADEILKNESASIASDCFVYPEELNKEK